MLILLIINLIVLPVCIAFVSDGTTDLRIVFFNIVSDTLFLMDIIVNFRSGVEHIALMLIYSILTLPIIEIMKRKGQCFRLLCKLLYLDPDKGPECRQLIWHEY